MDCVISVHLASAEVVASAVGTDGTTLARVRRSPGRSRDSARAALADLHSLRPGLAPLALGVATDPGAGTSATEAVLATPWGEMAPSGVVPADQAGAVGLGLAGGAGVAVVTGRHTSTLVGTGAGWRRRVSPGTAELEWLVRLGVAADLDGAVALSEATPASDGVILVPGIVVERGGDGRGLVGGLARGVGRGQLARAALEAFAFGLREALESLGVTTSAEESGPEIRVGGPLAASTVALGLCADQIGAALWRPDDTASAARGAALLAGVAAGIWTETDLAAMVPPGNTVTPRPHRSGVEGRYRRWQEAAQRARDWRPEREPSSSG